MILVTGGTGFIGRRLIERLLGGGRAVRASIRRRPPEPAAGTQAAVEVGDVNGDTDWTEALHGASVVVHLAARAHVMRDTANDPLAEYRRVNVAGTINLARQAAASGVRRFVFVSSIKAHGEVTGVGSAFSAASAPAPMDAYGLSKREAEQELAKLARDTGMEWVVVRPPLVYGPGVKGNFLALMRAVHRGMPLPLGAIYNRRSLVALDNLVDLLATCIDHRAAANRAFLVSDGSDLSTTELLRRIGVALGRSARLIPVPEPLLRWGAKALGQPAVAQRLCGSLQVDISETQRILDWAPPVTVDEGLRRTAEAFLYEEGV